MGLTERKSGIARQFCDSLAANVHSKSANAIMNAYHIDRSTGDEAAMNAILEYANDLRYFAPALTLARKWHGKAYYYHFEEPNPWEGPFKGCATHCLDAAFLFQNYNEKLSAGAREVAVSFARTFLDFANGKEPMQVFGMGPGGVKTFSSSENSNSGPTGPNEWNYGRRDVLFKLEEEGKVDLDDLNEAWNKFLVGQ